MKKLRFNDMEVAPPLVVYIWMCAQFNIPIGSGTFEEAIKLHPEYFPEEIEYRDKWSTVPIEVKNEYSEEFSKLEQRLYGDLWGKGLVYNITHFDESERNSREYTKRRKNALPEYKALYEKYFTVYGLHYAE